MNERIYLSPPNVDNEETLALQSVLKGGWVAPVGPELKRFELALEQYYPGKRVLATNSGTAALHLSLVLADIKEGDEVITSTLTFAACANVIRYQGAIPVFIDVEEETWNLDPVLLKDYLEDKAEKVKAIILTHLYGMPGKLNEIKKLADQYGIPLIEDAAEALGATYTGQQVGQFGDFGILSFNGNKIITTSGGGALIMDETRYDEALHLATQANRGIHEYDHDRIGYNYRLSNVLAALGKSQLEKLDSFIIKKRSLFHRYQEELNDYFDFLSSPTSVSSNRWLATALVKQDYSPLALILSLEEVNIEARRIWKPLHLQPAYKEYTPIGGKSSEAIFSQGICLPSGTGLTESQQTRIITAIKSFFH